MTTRRCDGCGITLRGATATIHRMNRLYCAQCREADAKREEPANGYYDDTLASATKQLRETIGEGEEP